MPKYHEWLERYPTLDALASAPEEEVARTGTPRLPIRRDGCRQLTREAVARYDSTFFLSDESTLRSFKGIGAYTAGRDPQLCVPPTRGHSEPSVARVLFRVFVRRGDPKAHAMRRRLWQISELLVPRARVFDFNQALMDFGATVCTARKPACLLCPMASMCGAYPFNPEHEQRAPKRAPKTETTRR